MIRGIPKEGWKLAYVYGYTYTGAYGDDQRNP